MANTQQFHAPLGDRQLAYPTKTFRRGETIPLTLDYIWLVNQGIVQISTLYPSGEESVIGFAFEAMPFGISMSQVDPYNAIALTNVTLTRLSIAQIQQQPALQTLIDQQAQRRLRQTEALIAMLGYRRVDDRLRQLLIFLAGEIGEATTEGITIGVRLTHQLIANTIGSTRVTTTRILGDLQREGWLTVNRQHQIILRRSSHPDASFRMLGLD
jgi:CRP-like cAMP-binding protein